MTCTEKDKHAQITIRDVVEYPVRVTYAGRLDRDSEGLLPVSYTHLDVYKRQKLASAVDQAVVALILIISNIYAISQKISGLEIKAGTGELTSENVIVQADKFIQTADAGQRFILRLGIVAVPVISIGAAYILIKRKYIIDERKYEELVAEIKSTNKK